MEVPVRMVSILSLAHAQQDGLEQLVQQVCLSDIFILNLLKYTSVIFLRSLMYLTYFLGVSQLFILSTCKSPIVYNGKQIVAFDLSFEIFNVCDSFMEDGIARQRLGPRKRAVSITYPVVLILMPEYLCHYEECTLHFFLDESVFHATWGKMSLNFKHFADFFHETWIPITLRGNQLNLEQQFCS